MVAHTGDLALDNGEVLGVAGLGAVKIPAWGTIPYLPPYCFEGDCAVGPFLLEALSPRLLQAPDHLIDHFIVLFFFPEGLQIVEPGRVEQAQAGKVAGHADLFRCCGQQQQALAAKRSA